MTGAEAIVRTLAAGGVNTCFANPGTSEIHLVAAMDRVQAVRCVPTLFEGVVTGAADGYARMAGKPACTLLHLAPGLANSLANLHNASRAQVPIVSLVGQHAASHTRLKSPLVADIESLARPYSKWLRTPQTPPEAGLYAAEAVTASRSLPAGVATLIVPADVAWGDGGSVAAVRPLPKAALPSAPTVEQAAQKLRSGLRTGIILADNGLIGEGLISAGRIAAGTGAMLLAPYPFKRIERGAGRPVVDRIPYVHEQSARLLAQFRQLLLVGAERPVSYFAHPGRPGSPVPEECDVFVLAAPSEDCAGALGMLVDALSLRQVAPATEKPQRPPVPGGAEMTLAGLADAVAALLPEGAIVADESMTSGRAMMAAARGAPPHDWLGNTGGSIGIGLPMAAGAAIASPGRRVVCLTADGSAMYTIQALWTIAREALDVTTVVFSNREYAVLSREYLAYGCGDPGPVASSLFSLSGPELDFAFLAKSMGVTACRARTLGEFSGALGAAFESRGPQLIEAVL
ncbi:MAG: acetolactate synthase large subunit [Terriglobia bacterium]